MIDKLRMPALLLAFAAGLTFPAAAASQKKAPECTVILDAASGDVVYREGVCDKRLNPFSTFKFPLALIGYDAGILEGEHTPAWDYKPEFDAVKRDRKTVDPTIWRRIPFSGFRVKSRDGSARRNSPPTSKSSATATWMSPAMPARTMA